MSRYDLVKEFNYYTRKRECYKEKLQINSNLKTVLEGNLSLCISYMQELGNYEEFSNLFAELYEKNGQRYSESVKSEILGKLDSLERHINSEISSAQQSINYWDAKIREFDEEERKRQGEER